MKPKSSLRSFLALAGSALLAISTAQADTLYWDGGDTGANAQGGTGSWDNTTTNWDTAATAGSDIDWDDSDFAIFGTPAGTVTLGAPITTSGMQFNVHSYNIDASTNALNFATGNNTISTNFISVAGNITSINGTVGGAGANLLFTWANNVSGLPIGHMISFGGASAGGWIGTTTIDKTMVVRLQDTNQALLNTSSINLRGGTIVLTNTSAQNTLDRVKDNAVINSYGGAIRVNNTVAVAAYSESLGELKLHGGNTGLMYQTNQNSGGSQIVSFSNINRTGSYSTMNVGSSFGASNIFRNTSVSTATPTGEIIGAWMIQGNATSQSEYTQYNSSGDIVGYTRPGANNIITELSLPTAWASTANMNFTGSPTLTANYVMNTLRTAGSPTWQLADYSLATNGIVAGGGNLTIAVPTGSGYLTAAGNVGSGNAIYLNSANGFIVMNAPVQDNGNAVTMVLTTGTNGGRIDLNVANAHTGGTVISAPVYRGGEGQNSGGGNAGAGGNIEVNHANGLGSNTTLFRMESGILDLNAIAATVGKFEGFTSAYLTGTGGTIFTVGNGTAANVTGNFAGTIQSVRLTKVGDGTQILSGTNVANNTTAQYTVNGGTLQFAKTSSLMNSVDTNWTAAKVVAGNGGTLAFNVGGEGEFTTGNVTTLLSNLGGANGTSTTGFAAGSKIAFDTTNATGTFTVANAIANSTGGGGGAIGLTKLGTGTLELSGSNGYTGPTTVAAGKLLVNGSTAAGSTVAVASGATLGGSGAISGAVNVSGQISAGNSIETLATGTLSMANSSTLIHELDSSVADSVASDLLKVTGDLNFTGTVNLTLADLALTDVAFAVNDKFSLINYTGAWNGGFLTFGVNELIDEEVFTFGLNTWRISYNDATGGLNYTGEYAGGTDSFVNITALTIIPEPTAALLGSLGLLTLLRRRRHG